MLEMDIPFREYLEEKFREINRRLDLLDQNTLQNRDVLEGRVREVEKRTDVLDSTRPTFLQLIIALFFGLTFATTVATIVVQIVL